MLLEAKGDIFCIDLARLRVNLVHDEHNVNWFVELGYGRRLPGDGHTLESDLESEPNDPTFAIVISMPAIVTACRITYVELDAPKSLETSYLSTNSMGVIMDILFQTRRLGRPWPHEMEMLCLEVFSGVTFLEKCLLTMRPSQPSVFFAGSVLYHVRQTLSPNSYLADTMVDNGYELVAPRAIGNSC